MLNSCLACLTLLACNAEPHPHHGHLSHGHWIPQRRDFPHCQVASTQEVLEGRALVQQCTHAAADVCRLGNQLCLSHVPLHCCARMRACCLTVPKLMWVLCCLARLQEMKEAWKERCRQREAASAAAAMAAAGDETASQDGEVTKASSTDSGTSAASAGAACMGAGSRRCLRMPQSWRSCRQVRGQSRTRSGVVSKQGTAFHLPACQLTMPTLSWQSPATVLQKMQLSSALPPPPDPYLRFIAFHVNWVSFVLVLITYVIAALVIMLPNMLYGEDIFVSAAAIAGGAVPGLQVA